MPPRELGRSVSICGMTVEGADLGLGDQTTLNPDYRDWRESCVCGEWQETPVHHPVGGTMQSTCSPPWWKILSTDTNAVGREPLYLPGPQNPSLQTKLGPVSPLLSCKSNLPTTIIEFLLDICVKCWWGEVQRLIRKAPSLPSRSRNAW